MENPAVRQNHLSADRPVLVPRVRDDSAIRPPGKHYGYSVWVPGLVFGVGYAAAAFAKLARGPEWVMNGTIKYFFITDSVIAPFDWGLQVANYPRLAIVMSLFAVATEALVVTAAFTRSEVYRLLMGLGGLGLLSGFWVFMGHFWPGWWRAAVALGFLSFIVGVAVQLAGYVWIGAVTWAH